MLEANNVVNGYEKGEINHKTSKSAVELPDCRILQSGAHLDHTNRHVQVLFDKPREILSSAVLGGGLVHCQQIINVKVNEFGGDECDDMPQLTLKNYCLDQDWDLNCVGMMTAASMKSLRILNRVIQGVTLTVLVTVGITNARRAGDKAEWRHIHAVPQTLGTINTIVISSAKFTPAALVEALVVATEAKTVAMQQSDIISPVSQQTATGTGTDSIAIVNGIGDDNIAYCGKHVLLGECLASMIIDAICDALDYKACS